MDSKLFIVVSLLGLGIVLYAVVRGKPDVAGASPDPELRASLQAFMDELERENQMLVDTIEQLKTELRTGISENRRRIEELEERLSQLARQGGAERDGTEREPERLDAMPALVFNEHYSRVVMMMKEGRTPEQIARDTGIGLGEIEMISNLLKQGNAV